MIMTPYDANFRRRRSKVGRIDRRGMDALEQRYTRRLRGAVDVALTEKVKELLDAYHQGRSEAELRAIADVLQAESGEMLAFLARKAVPDWFSAVDQYAANKFNRSVRDALGIDATSIMDQAVYDAIHDRVIAENVNLIQSLASDHYDKVIDAIYDDYEGVGFPGGAKSLAGRIQEITGVSKYRASVIARDQTSKLASQMAQARQEDAGITHYIWRTAGDQRVVGKPGGLYPEGNTKHGNHYERDGQPFAWNDPPSDGHPGSAICCRCVAMPVLNPAQLKAQATGTRVVAGMAVA